MKARALLVGSLLVAAAGVGLDRLSAPKVSTQVDASRGAVADQVRGVEALPEARVDALILKANEGIQRLHSLVVDKINALEDEGLKQRLMAPFGIMAHNERENPEKNHIRLKAAGATGVFDPKFFNFNELPVEIRSEATAAFQPNLKMMCLHPDFDPNNLLDVLFLYHELVHALQDAEYRKKFTGTDEIKEYFAFGRDPSSKAVLNKEAEARALQAIIFGLLRDAGIDLNANLKQKFDVRLLVDMSEALANAGGMKGEKVPRGFEQFVAEFFRRSGVQKLYRIDMDRGGLTIVQ